MGSNTRTDGSAAVASRRTGGLKSALLASAGLLLLAHPALAQQSVSSEKKPSDLEEVVVTGSRIATNGFQQPTPVTVVGQQEIDRQMPATIASYLTELPSFGPTAGSRAPGAGVSGGGTETVNL